MGEDGRFHWRDDAVRPGDAVDLVAAMDLLIAISNCPHPICPAAEFAPQPIDAIVWQPAADASDFAREAAPEAQRAYANTEHYNAQ